MAEQYNVNWHKEIDAIDVGSDKKKDKKEKDLIAYAKELLSSDDVRRLNPNEFNALVEEIKKVLLDRHINRAKVYFTYQKKRIELMTSIRARSLMESEKLGFFDKAGNLISEKFVQASAGALKYVGEDYIQDYDSKSGNTLVKISDFEKQLKGPIEKINIKGLSEYLKYLKNGQKNIGKFFSILSKTNLDILAYKWYVDQDQKGGLKNALIKDGHDDIVQELLSKLNDVMINKFRFAGSQKRIYEKYKDKLGRISLLEFSAKMDACKDTTSILKLLKSYGVKIETTADMANMFKSINSDIKTRDKVLEKSKTELMTLCPIQNIQEKTVSQIGITNISKTILKKKIKNLNIEEIKVILPHIKDSNIKNYFIALAEEKRHLQSSKKIRREAKQLSKGGVATKKAVEAYSKPDSDTWASNLSATIERAVEKGEKEDKIASSEKSKNDSLEGKKSRQTSKSSDELSLSIKPKLEHNIQKNSRIDVPRNFKSVEARKEFFAGVIATINTTGSANIVSGGIEYKLAKQGDRYKLTYGNRTVVCDKEKIPDVIKLSKYMHKMNLDFIFEHANRFVDSLKIGNSKGFNDLDGLDSVEKMAILKKVGETIFPGLYSHGSTLEENERQLKDKGVIGNRFEQLKKDNPNLAKINGKATSLKFVATCLYNGNAPNKPKLNPDMFFGKMDSVRI